MFSTLIIVYLFVGGATGGMYVVISVWSLIFFRKNAKPTEKLTHAFKALRKACFSVGLILLVVALLCLLFDLIYPERALLLFLRPHLTPITFGSYSLALLLIVAVIQFVLSVFNPHMSRGRHHIVLDVLSCILGLCVISYTAVLLYTYESVAIWHQSMIFPLFVLSSLSAGISVVLLTDYFLQNRKILLANIWPIQTCHLICLILEAVVLWIYLSSIIQNPYAADSLALLNEPSTLATSVIGVAGLGIVLPFCLEGGALLRHGSRSIPVSDVICLIGCFCLRWSIVICAVH